MLAIGYITDGIPRQRPVRHDAHIAMRLAAVRHRPKQRLSVVGIDVLFVDADDEFMNHSRWEKSFQGAPGVIRFFFFDLDDRHLPV